MIDQETTQEITGSAVVVDPASASQPAPPTATPPVIPPKPPKPAKRRIWPNVLSALFLVLVSSGLTYLVVTDSTPDNTVSAGTTSNTDENSSGGNPSAVVPADEPIANAAAIILPSVVQIQTETGVGSGVIYDSDGLILTAAHVVNGEQTVTVRLNDGEEMQGTVLGGTSGADVAVVKVDRTGLPAAELALDSDAIVGQMAIAVGSPWGLQGTVTSGIISAVNQSIPSGGTARSVLQTDAAINPGNSGGPLVDRDGRVLGINVSIFSVSGANDGVGFAVPIAVANDIAEQVVAGDSIETAFLGVSVGNVESGQAGALIAEVTPRKRG